MNGAALAIVRMLKKVVGSAIFAPQHARVLSRVSRHLLWCILSAEPISANGSIHSRYGKNGLTIVMLLQLPCTLALCWCIYSNCWFRANGCSLLLTREGHALYNVSYVGFWRVLLSECVSLEVTAMGFVVYDS